MPDCGPVAQNSSLILKRIALCSAKSPILSIIFQLRTVESRRPIRVPPDRSLASTALAPARTGFRLNARTKIRSARAGQFLSGPNRRQKMHFSTAQIVFFERWYRQPLWAVTGNCRSLWAPLYYCSEPVLSYPYDQNSLNPEPFDKAVDRPNN